MGASQSYGDAAISVNGVTPVSAEPGQMSIDMQGRLHVGAGRTIAEVVEFVGTRGWMLPSVPGAARATVGGVIAADAHGKDAANGSIGRHVLSVTVRRSEVDGRLRLTPDDPRFWSLVGGFGAGGLIEEAEIALYRIAGPAVCLSTIPFSDPAEWLAIASEQEADLAVASMRIDNSRESGSGAIALGRWVPGQAEFKPVSLLPVPFLPVLRGQIGRRALRLRARFAYRRSERVVTARAALWPMARLESYGPLFGGIVQHHARLPFDVALEVIGEIRALLRRHEVTAPIVALKRFTLSSDAPLGFVAPGVSIAIDLVAEPRKTPALLRQLAELTVEAGGAVYLAKDSGGLDPALAARAYPRAAEMLVHRDPASHPAILVRLFPEAFR